MNVILSWIYFTLFKRTAALEWKSLPKGEQYRLLGNISRIGFRMGLEFPFFSTIYPKGSEEYRWLFAGFSSARMLADRSYNLSASTYRALDYPISNRIYKQFSLPLRTAKTVWINLGSYTDASGKYWDLGVRKNLFGSSSVFMYALSGNDPGAFSMRIINEHEIALAENTISRSKQVALAKQVYLETVRRYQLTHHG